MAEAELARFIDRFTVQFVRVFPHPIDRVWRALTDPAELGAWCMPATIDLRVGGAYTFEGEEWGSILALDPPHLIRFGKTGIFDEPMSLDDNYFQYELEATAQGTRMTFIERWAKGPDYRSWFIRKFGQEGDDLPGGPDTPVHPGTLGGWHVMFDGLADHLDGETPDSRLPPSRLSAIATKWGQRKVRSGEFDADVAERYVRELRADEAYLDLIDIYRAHIKATIPAGLSGGNERRAGMAEGLARFIDHWTIEFVRTYPHPIERVWRAVTDPAEVSIWFIPPTVWEPNTGGRYRFHDDGFAGIVQVADPPSMIRFGGPGQGGGHWPGDESYFQFELEPVEGGTRLRYLQHAPPGVPDPDEPRSEYGSPGRPGALAGWHHAFEELSELLDGAPIGSRLPTTRLTDIVRNWAATGMSAEFTPEQKANILKGLRAREFHFELTEIYTEHVRATRPPA